MEQLLTGYRVQTGGRLIQEEQFGVVGQGQCQEVFDFHAVGKLLAFFAFLQGEPLEISLILGLIPVRVKFSRDRRDGREFLQRIEVDAAKHNADSLLARFFMLAEILAEQGDPPPFRRDHVEDGL